MKRTASQNSLDRKQSAKRTVPQTSLQRQKSPVRDIHAETGITRLERQNDPLMDMQSIKSLGTKARYHFLKEYYLTKMK